MMNTDSKFTISEERMRQITSVAIKEALEDYAEGTNQDILKMVHSMRSNILDFSEDGVIGRRCLTLDGHHLDLWVEGREERSHQVAEAVEHTQRDHQGHGGHSHTQYRDAADDVDGVGRLL